MAGLLHLFWILVLTCLSALFAVEAVAAGSSEKVYVADLRLIDSPVLRYFANLYNTDPLLLAVWVVVLTFVAGCLMGKLLNLIFGRHVGKGSFEPVVDR